MKHTMTVRGPGGRFQSVPKPRWRGCGGFLLGGWEVPAWPGADWCIDCAVVFYEDRAKAGDR